MLSPANASPCYMQVQHLLPMQPIARATGPRDHMHEAQLASPLRRCVLLMLHAWHLGRHVCLSNLRPTRPATWLPRLASNETHLASPPCCCVLPLTHLCDSPPTRPMIRLPPPICANRLQRGPRLYLYVTRPTTSACAIRLQRRPLPTSVLPALIKATSLKSNEAHFLCPLSLP